MLDLAIVEACSLEGVTSSRIVSWPRLHCPRDAGTPEYGVRTRSVAQPAAWCAGVVFGWFLTPIAWLLQASAYLQEVDEKKPAMKPPMKPPITY